MEYRKLTMKNIYVSKGIVSVWCISSHRSTIKIFQSGPVQISLRPFVSQSPSKRDYVKGCSSGIRNGDWYTAYRNTGGGEGSRGGWCAGEKWKEKENEERGLAVASREPAREDRWRRRTREPRNHRVLTRETSSCHRADRRDIHTRCFWGLGSIAGKPAAGAPSKSASLAWGMSDTRGPTDACGWSGI